jgi:isocitrate/isopropylmalate dehydrogenase
VQSFKGILNPVAFIIAFHLKLLSTITKNSGTIERAIKKGFAEDKILIIWFRFTLEIM